MFDIMSTAFSNFDSTVKNFLTKTLKSNNLAYSTSQIFVSIFEAVKGVMQNALFYVEDALTEQNIFMASRKKSVYSLAKVSGYEPYYGSAGTGIINVTTKITNNMQAVSSKIYINNYTRLMNKTTGMFYMIMLNTNRYVIDISSPILTHKFKIVQGNYFVNRYTLVGVPMEKVSVNINSLFDRNYFDVYVNGEKWTPVSSLYDMTSESKSYILTVGYENAFDILFGNGIYGKIPEAGSTLEIRYVVHSGQLGNIHLNEITDFAFYDKGSDSLGEEVDINNYVTVKLQDVVSGGTDADTIEFVREMIGANSRSNVLASEDNYKLFFKRFSFIGYVNCWCEPSTMIVNVICTSNILNTLENYTDYYTISDKQIKLNEDQKAMVVNTLRNSEKTFVGMTLNFEDPIVRKFSIMCYLKIDDMLMKSTVKESVSDAIAEYFIKLKDNIQFIPKSDLIAVILNADENIKSVDISIVSGLAEDTYKDGYYMKYEEQYLNGTYQYVTKKVFYEPTTYPGLDDFGNISLGSKFEIPLISKVKYYPNKDTYDKTECITLEPIQFFFI